MPSKHILTAMILLVGLSSCVPVPLVEKSKVPKEAIGLWLWDSGGERNLFDVQAFDSRACVADWMVVDKKTGDANRRTLVKAWITDIKGTKFLTLKMFRADAANNPPKRNDTLTMGKLELKKDRMLLHLLKPEAFKDIKTAAQLRKRLEARHKDPDIYMTSLSLKRVTTSDDRAKKILDAFHRK